MIYTINQLRQAIFRPVYQVYEVFQNFFGEEFVDLQGLPPDTHLPPSGCSMEGLSDFDISDEMLEGLIYGQRYVNPFILVYWPRVTVTNENEKSIVIQDLFAKIELNSQGMIPTENRGFTLNRATYPMDQWVSDYLHSHIQNIPKNNPNYFGLPCLGTGPIKETINSLRAGVSEGFDEVKWMLFCHELSLYVTVESLTGIPYRHLENVSLGTESSGFIGYTTDTYSTKRSLQDLNTVFSSDLQKEFIRFYLENGHLAFNYRNSAFEPGMPYYDFIIDISNSFIEWFNQNIHNKEQLENCFNKGILCKVMASERKFLRVRGSQGIPDVSRYIGRRVCDFKGREITLNIYTSSTSNCQETILLNHHISMYILNSILRTINYHYTNEYNKNEYNRIHRSAASVSLPATTDQNVYYL